VSPPRLTLLGSSGSQIGPGESCAFIAGRASWRIAKSPRMRVKAALSRPTASSRWPPAAGPVEPVADYCFDAIVSSEPACTAWTLEPSRLENDPLWPPGNVLRAFVPLMSAFQIPPGRTTRCGTQGHCAGARTHRGGVIASNGANCFSADPSQRRRAQTAAVLPQGAHQAGLTPNPRSHGPPPAVQGSLAKWTVTGPPARKLGQRCPLSLSGAGPAEGIAHRGCGSPASAGGRPSRDPRHAGL
jgi:hypothetical protein